MIRLPQPKIVNSKGEEVRLTPQEQYHAQITQEDFNRKFKNSLGYEVSITTLTTIMKQISEQKFYQIAPAKYFPVKVGEGTWSSNLTTYRSFDLADEFSTGIINTGGQNARLATADAGVDALNIKVENWAKAIGWSIFDLELAAKSGNWDLVSAKERSRKKNWDLGIQRVAFLGLAGVDTCLGLLNQPGVTINTNIIQKPISSMTPTELSTFCRLVYQAYRNNSNRTASPTHFIMPESDYNGLASQSSPDFPVLSKLQLIIDMFRVITQKADFQVLPLSYADADYHTDISDIAGKQVYTMLNYDEESLNMQIPLDYTNTLANSIDNFSFQNVGYGQLSGVLALRPLEMLYFHYSA